MIAISYMYPHREDGRFNLSYYYTKHIPLVQKIFGEALKWVQIEQGVQESYMRSKSPFMLVARLYFDSVDEMQEIFEKNKRVLMVDMFKFTDIQPVVQISDVIMDTILDTESDDAELPLMDFECTHTGT